MQSKKVTQKVMTKFPADQVTDSKDRSLQPKGGGSGIDPVIPQAEAPFGKRPPSPKK